MSIEDKFDLQRARIAIVGLGLMGGSLALALKGKCASIYGVDTDVETRELALKQAIVDIVAEDLRELSEKPDVIILAAPVPAILTLLDHLPRVVDYPCIVLDIGSSKVEIVKKMAGLPSSFDPIGGHPICGKERLSLQNADRTLYYSAPFILTPLERTTSRALSAGNQIVNVIGAKVQILSAQEHDRILACTSHLPFLLASALVLSTPPDVASLIGPGFRSSSRLAGTPSSMMLGVILSNRENLLAALERIQDEIALFTSAIADKDIETLEASLKSAEYAYDQLMNNK